MLTTLVIILWAIAIASVWAFVEVHGIVSAFLRYDTDEGLGG